MDKAAGTLTVSDNGIGMSRASIVEHLGTIARSGTREFLTALQQADAKERPELIGQFGVGFYSCFMVADEVTLETRKAGEPQGVRWRSRGDGSYTVEDIEKKDRGTTVILTLKPPPAGEDDAGDDFTSEWRIRDVVRRYSDFVAWPMKMVRRLRVHVIALARDAHGVAGDDFAPRRVNHAGLDAVLEVLLRLGGRVERQNRLAAGVGLEDIDIEAVVVTARRALAGDHVPEVGSLLDRVSCIAARRAVFLLYRLAMRSSRLRRAALRRMTMLDLDYGRSPLLEANDQGAGVRLPNPELRTPDGAYWLVSGGKRRPFRDTTFRVLLGYEAAAALSVTAAEAATLPIGTRLG